MLGEVGVECVDAAELRSPGIADQIKGAHPVAVPVKVVLLRIITERE